MSREELKDALLAFKKWHDKLTPSQKCTVHPPAGSGASTGLFEKTDGALVDEFIERYRWIEKYV